MSKSHAYYGSNIVHFWHFSVTVLNELWQHGWVYSKWLGEYKNARACSWRVCCGAVWYFWRTGPCVCVCVFWEMLAHKGNHTVCRSSQAAWPFGTPQTERVCAANMPRAQRSSPHGAQTYVYMFEHTPTLVRRGFTSQVLKHKGLLFDCLRAALLLPSSNKAMPHFKWKDFRLPPCHRCCCFDSAFDHIWHLTDAHAMIRFPCIRIIVVCNGNRV